MVRVILGSAIASVAMMIVGFLLFASPLGSLGSGNVGNAEAAQVQSTLALNLRKTGTYHVPDPETPEQTGLYSNGGVATIHYNSEPQAANDPTMFVWALILNFIVAMLIGLGLLGIDRRVPDFPSRARLVIPFALAAGILMHLSRSIYLHHDWSHTLYSTIADALVLIAGGLVVAWFLPRRANPAELPGAPTEV